jgi:Tfp pilus assembly protein FimV
MANALESGGGLRSAARDRYVVRQGDTVWSIAERLAPGEDPRPLVDAISAANHIDPGVLLPGRTLLIPAAD